jgi:hypothetical protein
VDVLNTPFNAVVDRLTEELIAQRAPAHAVTFEPETREVAFVHGPTYDLSTPNTVIYRFEDGDLNLASFREAWNQAKTDVLGTVEKRDQRFARLG